MAILDRPTHELHPDDLPPRTAPGVERDRTLPFGFTAIALLSIVAILGAMVAIGLSAMRLDDNASSAGAAGSTGATKTFDIELGDLFVKPSSITIDAGDAVVLNVMNHGQMQHDLKLDGTTGTGMIDPGRTERVELGTITADAQAWCTVPGHKEAGMVLDIKVNGSAPAAGAAASTGTAAATGAQIDFNAAPAPDWKPFDPTLQPAPGATEHNVTFEMGETVIEVAPGVTQEMWTFNGQAPGPVLRGKVGDVFNVTVKNTGKIGHSIDFHASKTPMDTDMRTLQPGESLVYQFKAEYSGIWMYHCGTAPALHHIGNGMFGAVVIDPPGLPKVDREYIFVQSELYTGPEGKPGSLDKMQREAHDAVVFNGYVNQYKHAPIKVGVGERIRTWVLDAGPSENSSFHIVGTVFDTVFKEGTYLVRPGNAERGGAQALDLQAAQGGFVEFTLDEAGTYALVTHKFANVGKGALGVFVAGDAAAAGMSH